jgi:hypothetical protein
MGAWTGAAADAPVADAPAATLEAATGVWTGAAADAPVATSEAPTMGISFFSIRWGFFFGVFSSVVEKMMGQERQRIREWASVEEEKKGLYKDEGGMYRNTHPLCTAAACTATRG